MSTPHLPLEPLETSIDDIACLEDGTLDQPLTGAGTLQSDPRPLVLAQGTGRRAAWTLAVPIAGALLVLGVTTGSPAPEQAPEPTQLELLAAWLAEHPQAGDDAEVRTLYAAQLAQAQLYDEAFEQYLTVVRRAPASPEGRAALGAAVGVAETLALADGAGMLWTERWVATVDRYARYWPGDPLTPVLVEDTVHTLVARHHVDQAEVLTTEHLYH